MRASDELSEGDARQLKMDLDDAMQQFKDIVLSKHWLTLDNPLIIQTKKLSMHA